MQPLSNAVLRQHVWHLQIKSGDTERPRILCLHVKDSPLQLTELRPLSSHLRHLSVSISTAYIFI